MTTMKLAPPILLVLALLWSAAARADVVICKALKDTSLDKGSLGNSNGGGPAFFSGTDGDPNPHRALLCFDLSGIPPGATIMDVQLTLTLGLVAGAGMGSGVPSNATISLYHLTQDWGEGTAESTASGVNATGHGLPASTGDATWNQAFFGTNGAGTAWANPSGGGAYTTTASATLFLDNNTVGNSFTWLSTPQLVADVQGWVNNSSTNFGWVLINADEVNPRTLFGFYSREWDNAHFAGGVNQVPALQVTYMPAVVPVPGWASWGAGAALLAVSSWSLRRKPCGSS